MSTLSFSIGGKIDPSYTGALNRAVTEAQAASVKMQRAIRTDITRQQKIIGAWQVGQPAAEVMGRGKYVAQQQLKLRLLQAQQERALLAASAVPAADLASNIGKAAHGVPGLNLALRETLTIFREIGSGNWSRVPGSVSRLVLSLRQMRGELGIFGALFTVIGAAAVGSIGAIVASFFIWEHRVKSLTKALTGLPRVDMAPPDISRLSAFEAGWRRVTEAIHGASVELNSANEIFKNHMAMINQAQGTEKRLLELERQKALDEVGNDPAKRDAIRAQFAQREHDLEKKQQDENLAAQRKHIEDLKRSQDENMTAAQAIKVATDEDARVYEAYLTKQVEENNKGTGKEGKGPSQIVQDQEEVARLLAKKSNSAAAGPFHFGAEDAASLEAAQGRLTQAQKDKTDLDEFKRTKKDRDDARREQKRLFDQAAKDAADKIKSEGEYNQALALNPIILADNDKLRAAEGDTAGGKDLDRKHGGRADVTARERVGLGAVWEVPLLNVAQQHLAETRKTNQLLGALNKGGKGPTGEPTLRDILG